MEVKVEHGLTRPRPRVDHCPVALRFQTPLTRQLCSHQGQAPEECSILRGGIFL